MFKVDNDNVECESAKINQGLEVGQQVTVGGCSLSLGFKGTSVDAEWADVLSQEVPAGLAENLLLQVVAYEPATGDAAAMTFNGLVISHPSGLSIMPSDMMNSLDKRINTPGAADWAFRAVIAPDVTPDTTPPTRNIKLQVKGELNKTIKWAISVRASLALNE